MKSLVKSLLAVVALVGATSLGLVAGQSSSQVTTESYLACAESRVMQILVQAQMYSQLGAPYEKLAEAVVALDNLTEKERNEILASLKKLYDPRNSDRNIVLEKFVDCLNGK